MPVRCDLEIMAAEGDGALWVQIDHISNITVRFTIEHATITGIPDITVLREMAEFILARTKR